MKSFNIVIEETAKDQVLAKIEALKNSGEIGATVAAGMKAIVDTLSGTQVAIAFNGSDDASGLVYASWHSHSDVRDVPNEAERMMPNEPGYDRDENGRPVGELHKEWAGMREAAMSKRLGRPAKL